MDFVFILSKRIELRKKEEEKKQTFVNGRMRKL